MYAAVHSMLQCFKRVMDPPTSLTPAMWMLWDAKDYDRDSDVALLAVFTLDVSLFSSPLGVGVKNDIQRQSDVIVGFVNTGGVPAAVELTCPNHPSSAAEGLRMEEGCILRVQVPAHGRTLAYHLGGLVVVGMRTRDWLSLTCDVEGVSAVYAMVDSRERQALAHRPNRFMPYHPQGNAAVPIA